MGSSSGRTALVTGAANAGGMGRSHALLLAERGAAIIAADIDRAGAEATAAAKRNKQGKKRNEPNLKDKLPSSHPGRFRLIIHWKVGRGLKENGRRLQKIQVLVILLFQQKKKDNVFLRLSHIN